MEPKIYIDIVFPVTWGMDAFLLWMAGRILGLRRKRWRFAFGGLFAAVCDCVWLFFLQRSGGALFSLLLLAGGVFIAYTPKSGKIFLGQHCFLRSCLAAAHSFCLPLRRHSDCLGRVLS